MKYYLFFATPFVAGIFAILCRGYLKRTQNSHDFLMLVTVGAIAGIFNFFVIPMLLGAYSEAHGMDMGWPRGLLTFRVIVVFAALALLFSVNFFPKRFRSVYHAQYFGIIGVCFFYWSLFTGSMITTLISLSLVLYGLYK
jgi:hypothetical protein